MIVIACILGFYATLPLLPEPEELRARCDHGMLTTRRCSTSTRRSSSAHQPATLLHELLGTGISAHFLSALYIAFLTFVPISLGVTLIWSSRVAAGVWYVTALTINWMLGALSYYLLPSLGPLFTRPGLFADLPATDVSKLGHT